MNKKEMIDLVMAQENAYNKKDLNAFCECYHLEVQIIRLATNETYSGLEIFRSKYKKVFEENPNLHCQIKSRITLDSTVVDEEWITGFSTLANGLHAVAIYGFRDGKIDRVWFAR